MENMTRPNPGMKLAHILGTEHIFNKIGGDEFFDLFTDYQKFQMGG